VTKSLWAGHVACKGELVNVYKVLVQKEHMEDLVVGGKQYYY